MPASGRFLLDTNIIIALLDGEESVLSNIDLAPEVFIPAVALGELFFGAAKSGRPAENTARVERFATGRAIVSADLEVAREYGRLKHSLKQKGRPLPENRAKQSKARHMREAGTQSLRRSRENSCSATTNAFPTTMSSGPAAPTYRSQARSRP